MNAEWFEALPEQCPPTDAKRCEGCLFSEREEAEKRLKLPKFKKANIALVILEPKDGVLKKTFGIAHYSWWRTKDFNVLQAKIV